MAGKYARAVSGKKGAGMSAPGRPRMVPSGKHVADPIMAKRAQTTPDVTSGAKVKLPTGVKAKLGMKEK